MVFVPPKKFGIQTHYAFAIFKHEVKSAGFTSTHPQRLVGMRYSDPNILTSTGLCRPTCPTPVPYLPGSASGFGSWFGYHPQCNGWAFGGPLPPGYPKPPIDRTCAVFKDVVSSLGDKFLFESYPHYQTPACTGGLNPMI